MRSVAAAALAGALLFLAFPPQDLGALAFVAFVPLFVVLRGRGPTARFALGWIAGNFAYTASVAGSILRAAEAYFDHPLWIDAGFALLAPQLYGALYFGLFAFLVGDELRAPLRRRLLTLPALWVAVELLRARFWHGAPWLLLGHSQHEHLRVIQVADVIGAIGIGFVVVLANVALDHGLRAAQRREPAQRRALLATAAALALVLVYGEMQMRRWDSPASTLRVGIVQPALPAEWRASIVGVPRSLARLRELSVNLSPEGLDLLIWPENALGFSLAGNDDLGRRVAAAAHGAATLLGAPRTVDTSDGVRFRNAAFLVAADGRLQGHYDKIRLTPWAEYQPLRLGSFGRRDFAPQDRYEPGTDLSLFEVAGSRFATLICFEAVYPELARAFVAQGAEFLVNLSNDDWFGDEAAVQQHFVASLFRAIENRRTLVRVTNSGQSGVVDPRGVVVASLPPGEAATALLHVAPHRVLSPYTRWGDAFAWMCVVVAVAARLRPAKYEFTPTSRGRPGTS
jgi:apolipoprotein N-acyltransferase